ncbi:MAG: ATP-binding cassette domain-containing protein [Actinobacteria bacterium]|nr:ATP-binding cassette domain-containing protein [Actinomycetota bacterium]
MADLIIEDLTVEYSSSGYVVRPIEDLSLEVSSGELVLLLGPSGCGKTTLFSVLAGILHPASGTVRFRDTLVNDLGGPALTRYRRSTVGIVFQAFNLIPSLSALENVAVPLLAAKMPTRQARARAETLLTQVDLADRMTHRPGGLSGGQQQRVAIARALAHDPPLLLADEPTAHLDYIQVEGILRLLRELATSGRVVVVATHDERLLPLADRIVELSPRIAARERSPEHLVLNAGDLIFRQGDCGERIYVVWKGEVELLRRREDGTNLVIERLRPGRYFGELAPIFGLPRSMTARAATDAVATGYTVADFRRQVGAPSMDDLIVGADVRLENDPPPEAEAPDEGTFTDDPDV